MSTRTAISDPLIDIVIPVYNEEKALAASIETLVTFLQGAMPFRWNIVIANNASLDATPKIAQAIACRNPSVRALHLGQRGRGRALKEAWSTSPGDVLVYMDVDLSTRLPALLPLVAPLVSGHAAVAIGSRLLPQSTVERGFKREMLSRTYNALIRTAFRPGLHDAQCGFKAIRADVARKLLPLIEDTGWFFDTELLLLARHNHLRVVEVPVDWVDDPDTRVHIRSTVAGDLAGLWRMRRAFWRGDGLVGARTPVTGEMRERGGLGV